MKAKSAVWLWAAAGILGCGALVGAQTAPPPDKSPDKSNTSLLSQLSTETESLYARVATSLVRVTVNQSPAVVLEGDLKTEFDAYLKSAATQPSGRGRGGAGGGSAGNGGGGGGGRNGDDRPNRLPGNPGMAGPQNGRGDATQRGPGPRGGMSGQVFAFLLNKAKEIEKTDPNKAATLRGLAFRVDLNRNGFQGEMSAIVFDKDGHALLPTGLLREAHRDPSDIIRVTLPDGATTSAKLVGANLFAGYSVIQLDKVNGLRPAKIAAAKLMPGQLMLSVTAGQSAASLVLVSGKPGTPVDDRFPVPPDDRNGGLLFNTAGDLVAVISGGGAGWLGDRQAMAASRILRETDYIINQSGPDGKPGKDIEPLSFGAGLAPPSAARKEELAKILGDKPGLEVTALDPSSMAQRGGLQKGDILLSIDGRPVSEFMQPNGIPLPALLQLQLDLATRTGTVAVSVIRPQPGKDPATPTLQLPLK